MNRLRIVPLLALFLVAAWHWPHLRTRRTC